MELHQITKANYLDILFEGRNKAYGSYELRMHYDQRIRRSLLFVLMPVVSLALYSFILNRLTPNAIINPIVSQPIAPIVVDMAPVLPKPKPVTALPKTLATYKNTVPVVVKNEVADPPKPDEIKGEIGKTNTAGDPSGTSKIPDIAGNAKVPDVIEPVKPAEPITFAEVMPEFIGDINSYMSRHLQYPEMARGNGIEGKVIVQFVVNEDGSVSNTKIVRGITGGCNEEAIRVVAAMPKWKPGKQNGHAVKVYYTLPIIFTLQ